MCHWVISWYVNIIEHIYINPDSIAYYTPSLYRSFATRVSQIKIWHFWVTGVERNICRGTFNRYSVITQFAKLAAGEQVCCHCTHTKLQHFKTFKSLSWKITDFELWYSCHKWAIWYSLLLLGYKPLQHITVLNTVGNCNTMVSIIILHYIYSLT